MKQSLERRTELRSLHRVRSFLFGLALFLLVLPSFGCVKRSRDTSRTSKSGEQFATITQTRANDQQPATSPPAASNRQSPQLLNINTSSANVLETLPGIGKGLAERIVDHREKYGPFRRPEHLIIVRGISDRRFRALRDLITV
jgi:competence ComEA-like helix-hairpin-helix protein